MLGFRAKLAKDFLWLKTLALFACPWRPLRGPVPGTASRRFRAKTQRFAKLAKDFLLLKTLALFACPWRPLREPQPGVS
jgi:hypothetical protein